MRNRLVGVAVGLLFAFGVALCIHASVGWGAACVLVSVCLAVTVWQLANYEESIRVGDEKSNATELAVAYKRLEVAQMRADDLELAVLTRLTKLEAEFKEAVLGQSFGR